MKSSDEWLRDIKNTEDIVFFGIPENTKHHSYAHSIENAIKVALRLCNNDRWDAYICNYKEGFEIRRSMYVPVIASIVRMVK